MSTARELAEFLTRTTIADLPAQAVDHAAMLIASTLSSAAMGRGIQSAAIIRDMARERGGNAQASLWFDAGPRLPVSSAAQVNAVASDAAASDDSDLRNIVHCGTPLTATALALAEHNSSTGGSSGEDVLAAIVLGYELAGHIIDAVPDARLRGFHGSTRAIFAATGAAGRLLGLNTDQMTHAIGLAATSAGGLAKAADTSVAREYNCGNATLLGIQAAEAARRGYTCEERVLEMKQGYFEAFGGTDGEAASRLATAGLGAPGDISWDIVTDMAVKLVPGGHPYHALGEAAANAAREGNIRAEEVENITVSRPGMTALSGPLHPKDLIDMAHSPAYFTASGVADRRFSWEHAGPAKIADPVIHALIDKIRVGPEPTANAERYRQGATVTIRTSDGREVTNTVYAPTGSGLLGIAWADIDAKFRALMPLSGLPETRLAPIFDLIRDFRRQTGVGGLIGLLRPEGA